LFAEVSEIKGAGKAIGALYTTPGLTLLTTVDTGPVGALFEAYGKLYVVSNKKLYSVNSNFVATFLGDTPGPGVYAYNFKSKKFSPVVLPFAPAQTVQNDHIWMVNNGVQLGVFVGSAAVEQDGFVVMGQLGSYTLWQSDLLDLTTFNPLTFASSSGNPDYIYDMTQIRREIFVHKQNHTEVWVNAGTQNFAFQQLDGVYIEAGTTAQSSKTVGETIMWMFTNDQGASVVIQCKGFNPQRVSTHALENAISSYPKKGTDAVAYTFLQNGHEFYVITFISGDATWVYDATTSQLLNMPMWHEIDSIDSKDGSSHRHWGNCHAYFNGMNIVGDYRNGNLYSYDLSNGTDNDTKRRWLRSWRALEQPVEDPIRFNQLRIDMQTGLNVPEFIDPLVTLRCSDDGAHTFPIVQTARSGAMGETSRRVMFRRLGSTRRNAGLDRVFELSSGDNLPTALIGAELT
jgi:hypothetical protein